MSEIKKKPENRVIIKGRLSYCNLFYPKKNVKEDGTTQSQYGCQIIIDKSDTNSVDAIKKAIEYVKVKDKSILSNKNGLVAGIKLCLRDGDDSNETVFGDKNYVGKYFINATNKERPGLLDENRQEVIDDNKFYSGCYAYVSLNLSGYNSEGNRGIGAYINNALFIKDGERLDGRISAVDDFNDIPYDENI